MSWSPGNQSSILSNNWLSFPPNVFFEFFSMFSFILTFLPRFSLLHSLFNYWITLLFHLTTSLFWFGFAYACVSMCVSAFHSDIYSFLLSSLIIFIIILIFCLICYLNFFGEYYYENIVFLKESYCYIYFFLLLWWSLSIWS